MSSTNIDMEKIHKLNNEEIDYITELYGPSRSATGLGILMIGAFMWGVGFIVGALVF